MTSLSHPLTRVVSVAAQAAFLHVGARCQCSSATAFATPPAVIGLHGAPRHAHRGKRGGSAGERVNGPAAARMSHVGGDRSVKLPTNHARKADAYGLAAGDELAPVVVLVRPFLDQNVGATARNMLNFGLARLRLVAPVCNHLSDDAMARASGARDVLNNAEVFATVEEAVADCHMVLATTARLRDMTQKVMLAEDAAQAAVDLAQHSGGAQTAAFLFGPETSGLENADLSLTDVIVQIPTSPNFSSLNLAQAVNIISYETWRARASARDALTCEEGQREGTGGGAGAEGRAGRLMDGKGDSEALADKGTLANFFARLEGELEARGYVTTEEKRRAVFPKIRNVFLRAQMTEKDVSLMHGIVTALIGGKQKTGGG